ncbi:MAG: DUF1553 domain-containing protein [Verrucomicrobia bacterium]|nr:DUF1553 domain-containing protein [Verrucomicrobiota bacterium]
MREAAPLKLEGAKSIDDFVFGWLKHLQIEPAEPATDAEFFRRVHLDVTGTLPTATDAREFLSSRDANKRGALIDRLLERDEFADYWAMKWGDVLRIKAEFPINLWPNAAQAYHRWVRASLAENKPYDKFVREMLTSSGSNFRVGQVNFYRAMQSRTPEGIAMTAALTFMGARADAWPDRSLSGITACFEQVGYKPTREWKEEIVFWDSQKLLAKPTNAVTATNAVKVVSASRPTNAPPQAAVFPDGTPVKLTPDRDPREVFADWLITPKNPWFARSIVNRVWSWFLGRGIIHEPDDIRDGNPPSNPDLLAYLERELVTHRYDLKHIYRLILNSRTYQLSSRAKATGPLAEAHFASCAPRRLEAEVLLDAINKVTGTSDLYTSPIPEPFTYIPKDTPAVALADGSITSPFLALFGRSARATGMESERINKVQPAQWLHLLNSSHIQRKIEQGAKLRAILEAKRAESETVEELYLAILSRFPTAEELKTVQAYGAPVADAKSGKPPGPGVGKKREDWLDIAWALLNSEEFLYRH